MSGLKVCRICLCKGVKVYNYNSFHLKQYYEEIMTRKVNEKDGLPNYFCYECAAVLHKFHKFKEKCWMGEKALKELLWSGPITFTSVSQIDRQVLNLQSSIDIITVSKTCIIKNKTLPKSLIKETKKDEIPETEEYVVEYNSDDSSDDKNPAETKNEKIKDQTESIEDEKTKMHIEMSIDKKAIPNIEDDRMLSADDDSNSNNINVGDKRAIKEEISDEIEDLEDDRMLSADDDSNSKDINIVDKPATKEEISDEITVEEERINFNSERTNIENKIVLNKNHKDKKRKKSQTKTDVPHKKAKKFEVNTKKNYLDPNHWLRINLTQEEALEEFRARAQDQKYVKAAYKCSDCYKGFSKEDMLNRHIKQRHSESLGPVQCHFCNMRFKMKYQITKHIPQHYHRFKCLRCDRVCPLEYTALLHNEYHNGVIRRCTHCDQEFRHVSTYYTHLRSHRSEYVCTQCGASFVSTKGLNMHKKRTMHMNTVINPEEGVTHTDTYCDRCNIKFETPKAYQEHVFHSAKHAEVVDDLECETPTTPSIPERERKFLRYPRKLTPCTICNKNFSSLRAYLKHHAQEHKDVPLPSKEEQRHICEICGASILANSVASHLNTHTRDKLYNCSICNMQFNTKTSMTRHQLTHTGEKPHKCSMCEKRFTQNCSLKLHYRTFHLKEPYPKRNRKKKNDDLSKNEFGHEDSDDNMTLDNFYARKYKRNK